MIGAVPKRRRVRIKLLVEAVKVSECLSKRRRMEDREQISETLGLETTLYRALERREQRRIASTINLDQG